MMLLDCLKGIPSTDILLERMQNHNLMSSEQPNQAAENKTINYAIPIHGLCSDSRKIKPGDLFIACAGTQSHGCKYIEQAISKGASAILYEHLPGNTIYTQSIPIIPIQNLSKHLGWIASRFYQDPSHHMQMIGITGTNGKTTCSQLIAQTLHALGKRCGVIGTLGYGFPPEELTANINTTPDPITLQYQLSMLKIQASICAMEVSSHGLLQERTQGVQFDIGIFTNLSQDHLDYHKTMENYWKAKRILFEEYPLKHAIINVDEPHGIELIKDLKEKIPMIGYTIQEHAPTHDLIPIISAQKIRLSPKGIQAQIISPWGQGILKSQLLGRFNLQNLLASLAALCMLDFQLPFDVILEHLARVKTVTGRMQVIGGGKKQPLIVIDYAHTPAALQQSLMALKEHTQGKLWCVFGCGGDRDQGKRPLMGKIAEHYSDQLIITDDNPRNENPKKIVEHIVSGLSCPWAAEIEHDRRIAIAHAVDCANSGDMILIAGKGHEHYQYILDKKIKFNDFEQAQLALQAKARQS